MIYIYVSCILTLSNGPSPPHHGRSYSPSVPSSAAQQSSLSLTRGIPLIGVQHLSCA